MTDATVGVPVVPTDVGQKAVDCEIAPSGAYRQRVDAQLKYLDVETGLETYAEGHHGMPHFVDYMTAIGIGLVTGHSRFSGRGRRDSLATTAGGDDISDIAGVALPFPDQSVGEQMTLVSSSADDTSAGIGAQTVKVHFIKADGSYDHEVVTMNGQTPVNTVATDIRFIQEISVQTIGTFGGKAVGNITIYRTGDAARVYARIVAGGNVSLSTARMVPAGVNFYLTSLNVSGTSGKPLSVRLTATCDHAGVYTPGVFQFNEIVEVQDSAVSIAFAMPRKIPALSIIKAVAVSLQAGGSVAVSYDGWTEG